MAKFIKHQHFFAHPVEAVWDYLTNSELMAQWLMKNDFKPVVGHKFQFTATCSVALDFSGIVNCEVLEVVPYKKLAYTWQCNSMSGELTVDSVVNWTLLPKNNGTELLLEHNDFKILKNLLLFNAMEQGWIQHINTIDTKLEEIKDGHTHA